MYLESNSNQPEKENKDNKHGTVFETVFSQVKVGCYQWQYDKNKIFTENQTLKLELYPKSWGSPLFVLKCDDNSMGGNAAS